MKKKASVIAETVKRMQVIKVLSISNSGQAVLGAESREVRIKHGGKVLLPLKRVSGQ